MSCGTKLTGRFDGYSERRELAESLEREGEYSIAQRVQRGECLDGSDLRRAEHALDSQGKTRHRDYREESCHCSTEDEY